LLLSDAVQLHKIVARHLVRGDGQGVARTRDEVRDGVLAAASDIVDSVYGQIEKVEEARRVAKTGNANRKFAGDDVDGTFEGKFASAEAFHGGLDRYLGLPDPKVLNAIINEHRNAPNSDTPYTTTNYGLRCTPRQELVCVSAKSPPVSHTTRKDIIVLPLSTFPVDSSPPLLPPACCLVLCANTEFESFTWRGLTDTRVCWICDLLQ
jgi:hypothetical protein